MKCPKCNYTSFDYLDNCDRCGAELRDVRTLLQIIAVSPEERTPSPPTASAPEPIEPETGSLLSEPAFDDRDTSSDLVELTEDPFEGVGTESASAEAAPVHEFDETAFEGLEFEESFEDLVEPTSYDESATPPQASSDTAEDDELLDLDFDDLFTEEAKEKA
jgi:hypothetical protein